MRLCRIAIRNFRCIESIEIRPLNYTTLIGPNNAGKSSVLRAIEIFLNQSVPELDEWRKGHETEPIEIEAEFDEILDWERNTSGASGLVHADRIKLRLRVLPPDLAASKKKPELIFECMKPEETIEGFFDTWADLDQAYKTIANELSINGSSWRNGANRERVRQEIRKRHPEKVQSGQVRWTSEGLSIDAALKQALPQAQLIPAVRDASSDGSPGASTSFGLLLKSIILPAIEGSTEYVALLNAVRALEQKLKGDGPGEIQAIKNLADAISDKLSSLITAKVTLGMDATDAGKFIGSNTLLRLDDGTPTRIALQGHGLQRALVFAMLEIIATQKATGAAAEGQQPERRSTVLLFEEPELFMHPHMMRRLKEALTQIGARPEWQVIVSTHSPFLIDIGNDRRSLVIHKRSSPMVSPTVTQLATDPLEGNTKKEERERLRAVLDFHPTVCEAFFAKNVVLVEGDTELAALVRQDALYRLASVNLDIVRDTTFVSCDGKWTIVPIARLLREFGVPVRVVHDADRKGLSEEELRARPGHEWHANARIEEAAGAGSCHAVGDTFEDVLSTPGVPFESSEDKPYRAWRRIRELCTNKSDLSHVPKLKAVLDFVFAAQASPPNGPATAPASSAPPGQV